MVFSNKGGIFLNDLESRTIERREQQKKFNEIWQKNPPLTIAMLLIELGIIILAIPLLIIIGGVYATGWKIEKKDSEKQG